MHDADERLVDCIEDCELAYAISGPPLPRARRTASSWLPRTPAGGKTLTRRLLYTAISRAQERCYCLGPGAAFLTAAQTAPKRATLLRGLLEAGPQPVRTKEVMPVRDDGHIHPTLINGGQGGQRKSSAQLAAEVAARMAALNPVRHDLDEPDSSTATGPRIVIGQPGRGKVAAALGI